MAGLQLQQLADAAAAVTLTIQIPANSYSLVTVTAAQQQQGDRMENNWPNLCSAAGWQWKSTGYICSAAATFETTCIFANTHNAANEMSTSIVSLSIHHIKNTLIQ